MHSNLKEESNSKTDSWKRRVIATRRGRAREEGGEVWGEERVGEVRGAEKEWGWKSEGERFCGVGGPGDRGDFF